MYSATCKTLLTPNSGLTPPWWTLFNQVTHTIGLTPGVTVEGMDTSKNPYVIWLSIPDQPQAEAMATIVKPQHDMGNIEVQVLVHLKPGDPSVQPLEVTDPAQVVQLVATALQGNPLLVGLRLGGSAVWPIFTDSVVQFWNDDLSEYFGNYNEVTAKVFKTLLQEQIGDVGVGCSTMHK